MSSIEDGRRAHHSDALAKMLFISAVIFLLTLVGFAAGFATGKFKIWPYSIVRDIATIGISVAKYGEIHPHNRITERPEGAHSGERISLVQTDKFAPGFRAITGYDTRAGIYAVWLIDAEGRQRHSWPIDYAAITEGTPSASDNRALDPHGVKILRDGSVLVNFDGGAMLARINACGRPVWKKPGIYHHSIEGSGDGTFWTWEGRGTAYGDHQYLVQFDAADGRTLSSLHLIDDIARASQDTALALSIPQQHVARDFAEKPEFYDDIFHPNDVEPLPAALAAKFPMFKTGDLLISLRSTNFVGVLDPDTKTFKWAQQGPWIGQHDPDYLPDGTISVYNNNTGREVSNILIADPATGQVRHRFDAAAHGFFSASRGKHDQLPSGGVLITIPDEGRVVELDRSGRLVMEFNNVYSARENADVANAEWLPPDYFRTIPSCGQ